MLITADVDGSELNFAKALAKGLYFLGKLPDEVRLTAKGYHLIYRNIESKKNEFILRKIIGDDFNRILLDMRGTRITNVLFNKKIVKTFGFAYSKWFGSKKNERVKKCVCGRKIIMGEYTYGDDEKSFKVYHKDGICEFKVKPKKSFIAKFLEMLNVKVIRWELRRARDVKNAGHF